ncbi:hypothetical protein DEO72_LG2g3628 [Vigna unguiculata]|uniref:CBS domain-containing protein n=1 Tax=Vigna unguiculata TaxID=3917 RepID=A0A4D6L4C9_VIGUN|nr:hypothetical protein DEO72_LG2g3628 [Vigna unguiculata]
MNSIHLINTLAAPLRSFSPPSLFPQCHYTIRSSAVPKRRRSSHSSGFRLASGPAVNSVPVSLLLSDQAPFLRYRVPYLFSFLLRVAFLPSQRENGTYTVADFMTKKQDLHVVKTTTTVDEALEALVNNRISGLPVIDDNWNLVGVVSDYDLLAIDSISGGPQSDANLFPNVDSSWKTFNELQKLLSKTNGQVVGDLMTPTPLVVHESTSLEEAARLLLETKYRRLPVVDDDGKLAGLITRGNIVKAALLSKRAGEW